MSMKYERLPTSPTVHSRSNSLSHSRSPSPTIFPPKRSASRLRREAELNRELQRQTDRDPRFNTPAPAAWKRIALLIFIGVLFWLSFWARSKNASAKSKVTHANRYSNEYKFRPAASPVITELLKDGRMRVRGAHITGEH